MTTTPVSLGRTIAVLLAAMLLAYPFFILINNLLNWLLLQRLYVAGMAAETDVSNKLFLKSMVYVVIKSAMLVWAMWVLFCNRRGTGLALVALCSVVMSFTGGMVAMVQQVQPLCNIFYSDMLLYAFGMRLYGAYYYIVPLYYGGAGVAVLFWYYVRGR